MHSIYCTILKQPQIIVLAFLASSSFQILYVKSATVLMWFKFHFIVWMFVLPYNRPNAY